MLLDYIISCLFLSLVLSPSSTGVIKRAEKCRVRSTSLGFCAPIETLECIAENFMLKAGL